MIYTENQSQTSGPDSGTIYFASVAHSHTVQSPSLAGSSHIHASGGVSESGSFGMVYDTTYDWIAVGTGYA